MVKASTDIQAKKMVVDKWHSCERKVRHKTKQKAENMIKSMRKMGFIFTQPPKIYRCPLCNGFHIAHAKRNVSKNNNN